MLGILQIFMDLNFMSENFGNLDHFMFYVHNIIIEYVL